MNLFGYNEPVASSYGKGFLIEELDVSFIPFTLNKSFSIMTLFQMTALV